MKGLKDEIASIAFAPSTAKKSNNTSPEVDGMLVWVACGGEVV